MLLSETWKYACLWGARSFRSLAHIILIYCFQLRSSIQFLFLFSNTPTNCVNIVWIGWPKMKNKNNKKRWLSSKGRFAGPRIPKGSLASELNFITSIKQSLYWGPPQLILPRDPHRSKSGPVHGPCKNWGKYTFAEMGGGLDLAVWV